MDVERSAIYNPFIFSDRVHFPSFTEAFGELLKIEAANLRKENEKERRHSKQAVLNVSTPMSQQAESVSLGLSYGAVTPIPCKAVTVSPGAALFNKSKPSTYHVGTTPMPTQKKKKKKKQKKEEKEKENENNLSIIVTPAPSKTKKRVLNKNAGRKQEESLVIMMADLMSPNPHQRSCLSSPAPHDKNGKLLNQTPASFEILMPPTPAPQQQRMQRERERSDLEEKWCNDYFSNHVPILTPAKKRSNPVKLYDPSKDMDATMMLELSDAPFQNVQQTKEADPVDIIGDISMIAPAANINASFPNEMSLMFGTPQSEIKATPQLQAADDLLLSPDVMNDDEFFETSDIIDAKMNTTCTVMEDQSTQTDPVLVVAEEDIPKIRFNGKQVVSLSAIAYNELHDNISHNSAQSDNIMYFTPILRHNEDSIESFYDISYSDSDSDVMVQNGQLLSLSYNASKKKQNGNKMLKAYKQSKLAQNPNWTICNSYSKTGELI